MRVAPRATVLRRECCTDPRAKAIRAQEEMRPNSEEARAVRVLGRCVSAVSFRALWPGAGPTVSSEAG